MVQMILLKTTTVSKDLRESSFLSVHMLVTLIGTTFRKLQRMELYLSSFVSTLHFVLLTKYRALTSERPEPRLAKNKTAQLALTKVSPFEALILFFIFAVTSKGIFHTAGDEQMHFWDHGETFWGLRIYRIQIKKKIEKLESKIIHLDSLSQFFCLFTNYTGSPHVTSYTLLDRLLGENI